MATADYIISNQSGASFRTDLNNTLAAIVSNNSNSSSPATTYAYQWWADTSTGILKIRNSANNAWIELLQLDGTLTLEDGSASTPALAFRDDLDTGIYSDAANTFNVATGGVERMQLGSETVFNETGVDVDFRIEGDTEANLFFVDASSNRIGIGTSTPASALDLQGDMTITSANPFINFIDTNNDDDFNISAGGGVFAINSTTDSLTRLQIGSAGKVSIGTTTPHSGAMLTIASKCLCVTGQNNAHLANAVMLGQEGSGVAQLRCYGPDSSTFGQLQIQLSASDGSGNLGDITFARESNGANIKLPEGGGISFAAAGNAGGMTSEILDDYEEGSWNATSLNFQYDGNQAQRGSYIKIGRLVHAFFRVKFHTQTSTSHLRFSGLPFTAADGNPYDVGISGFALGYSTEDFNIEVSPGSSYAYWYTTGGSSLSNSTSLNGADIRGLITYTAAS